jgi:hypothetical protein
MSLKDKLEIGLKPDAPYRADNLPEFQQDDPNCRDGSAPGHSAAVEAAREDCDQPNSPRRAARRKAARPAARGLTARRTATAKSRPAPRSSRPATAASRRATRTGPAGAKPKR